MTASSTIAADVTANASPSFPIYAHAPLPPKQGVIPNEVSFIYPIPGGSREPLKNGGELVTHRLRVEVYSAAGQMVDGETEAELLRAYLNNNSGIAPFFEVYVEQAEPEFLGVETGTQRYRHILDVIALERVA